MSAMFEATPIDRTTVTPLPSGESRVLAKLPPPDFPNYAAGSQGPAAANELIREELRGWNTIAPALHGADAAAALVTGTERERRSA